MGAAGLGFHMTQFCLRGARPLSEGEEDHWRRRGHVTLRAV